MQFKDYYKILGVEPDASADQIKQAHRKLAFKYHPDQNPGMQAAEEKFKEINEAYHVLGDEEKRKLYDSLTLQWIKSKSVQEDISSLGRRWGEKAGVAAAATSSAFPGASDFFKTFFGSTGATTRQRAELEISLEEAYRGAKPVISYGEKKIQVRIPPGTKSGQVLKLSGQGKEIKGKPTDLLLKIKVKEHPVFKQEGPNLYADLPIKLYMAVLGGKKRINTFKGGLNITLKPATQHGQVIRLKKHGMPWEKGYGDLFLTIQLELPKDLSGEALAAFEQLKKLNL